MTEPSKDREKKESLGRHRMMLSVARGDGKMDAIFTARLMKSGAHVSLLAGAWGSQSN